MRAEHDYAPWEKRVDAILRLLTDRERRIMTVDELRRGIEELGPGAYDELSYYQRWMASIGENLLEKGVITVDELGRRMAEVEARWRAAGLAAERAAVSARFAHRPAGPGAARILPPGHVRTPHYLRGQRGVVESIAGHFANPEELAYGRDGLPRRALYRVRFRQARALARLCRPARGQRRRRHLRALAGAGRGGPMTGHRRITGIMTAIRHPQQPDLEDQPFEYHQLMAEAVGELLIEKGVFSADELRRTIEDIDARSRRPIGARLVARAWVDPAFKARLLEDVNAAARELGIDAGAIPIRALENTAQAAQRGRAARSAPATRAAARPAARLVQGARLSLARGPRAARRAGRVRHRSSPTTSRSACTTARPICATWSCRCARPAPRGCARSSWPRW